VPFWRVDYSEKIGGKPGNVSVRIYDMQYSTNSVTPSVLAALPPSVRLKAAIAEAGESMEPGAPLSVGGGTSLNAGVYLIRATITFANEVTNKIDLAIVQNSNPNA
jgi:hypothetical protein